MTRPVKNFPACLYSGPTPDSGDSAISLREFGNVFHRFAQAIENGDAKAVEDELARAKARRDNKVRSE